MRAKTIRSAVCVAVLCATGTIFEAHAFVPRTHHLVCGFADGSRIEVKAKYKDMLVDINPHGSRYFDHEPWSARYISPWGKKSAWVEEVHHNSSWLTEEALRGICRDFQLFPYGREQEGNVVRDFWRNERAPVEVPLHARVLAPADGSRNKKELKPQVFANGLRSVVSGVVRTVDGLMVLEIALSRQEESVQERLVDAVWQAVSTDVGRTWSEGQLVYDTVFWDLGKRWDEQCFVGKPVLFDGKSIDSKIPAPCKPPNMRGVRERFGLLPAAASSSTEIDPASSTGRRPR